jgi:hypothetical protein
MNDLLTFWKPIARAFDPRRPIAIGDPDHYYVARPDSPLGNLATELMVNLNNPRKIILAGHRGSGKSSELAKLAGDLASEAAVIWIDAQSTFNMFDVGNTELLLSLGTAIHREVPVNKEFEALKDSLSTYIQEKIGGTTAALTTEALKKVGLDFRHTLFDKETRRKIEIPPILGDVVNKVNLIIAAAQKKTKRPLLIVLDGLDRLDLEAARPLFVNNQLLAEPQCHIIFTVPISLYCSIQRQLAQEQGFMPVYLPNVKLHPRDSQERIPEGFALMQQIVVKRLRGLAPEAIASEALDLFIEMSGGLIREMITLIERTCIMAIRAGVRQIDRPLAEKAVSEYRLDKARALTYDYYYEEMARIHETGQLTARCEKDYQGKEFVVSYELVEGLYVLCYSNEDPWYDVHPIMLPSLQRRLAQTK